MFCRIKRTTVDPDAQLGGTVSKFAIALLQKMNFDTQNVFSSPTSIAIALGMVLAGAGGDTREQLLDVLKCDEKNEASIHNGFASLIKAINDASGQSCELYIANRLYSKKCFGIRRRFTKTLGSKYDSDFKQVDFADPSVRSEINKWVDDVTRGRIRDLIPEGLLTGVTQLVIVNAVYFKAEWSDAFSTTSTHTHDFYVSTSEKTEVRMMMRNATYLYTEDDTCQAIQLPYRGDSLCMVIILPKVDVGLSNVVRQLNSEAYLKLISAMQSQKVKVYLPKFKLEVSYRLPQQLASLGMVDMFSPRANFDRMTTAPISLCVSEVIHKAFVEVNEEGTEAAAATAVVMKRMCHIRITKPEPIIFKADHPFIFSIFHQRLECPLFFGTLMRP